MENIYYNLQNLLKSGEGYLDAEGRLNRTLILNKAYDGDGDLLDLLLGNPQMHKQFFTQTAKALIFKRDDFIEFIAHKNFLADSYTDYKNKIGLGDGKKYLKASNDTVLMFPFKDCVLEGGMSNEEEGKREIFYNEILAADEIDRLKAPKLLTNIKRITAAGESQLAGFTRNENGRITDNLLIKGNNFCALHSLKAEFENRVKLIYIDPPYNTGNDSFKYNDRFNHSTWLTFMKNRLEVARELLRDDGVIFIQCDDNEQAYLKVLMDEVFGRENSLATFYIQVRYGNKTLAEDNDFQKVIEQCLCYSNNFSSVKLNKDSEPYKTEKFEWQIIELEKGIIVKTGGKEIEIFQPNQFSIKKIAPSLKGLKETWATGSLARQKGSSGEFLYNYLAPRKNKDGLGCLYKVMGIGEDGLGFRYMAGPKKIDAVSGKFYSGIPLKTLQAIENGDANQEKPIQNFYDLSAQFGNCRHEGGVGFRSGKKPEKLLSIIVNHFTQQGDIVLDFFAGSGTTAAVAHKMGRQYIAVEQMDYIETITKARLQKVIGVKTESDLMGDKYDYDTGGISKNVNWQGGGEFIYTELAPLNQTFIDAIHEADNLDTLLKIRSQLLQTDFTQYQLDHEAAHDDQAFVSLTLNEQKQILISMLDKNQLYVNYSERTDSLFKCSQEDIKLSEDFYKGE